MAITQQQIQDSEKQQFEAAHDPGPQYASYSSRISLHRVGRYLLSFENSASNIFFSSQSSNTIGSTGYVNNPANRRIFRAKE